MARVCVRQRPPACHICLGKVGGCVQTCKHVGNACSPCWNGSSGWDICCNILSSTVSTALTACVMLLLLFLRSCCSSSSVPQQNTVVCFVLDTYRAAARSSQSEWCAPQCQHTLCGWGRGSAKVLKCSAALHFRCTERRYTGTRYSF